MKSAMADNRFRRNDDVRKPRDKFPAVADDALMNQDRAAC
jgi:hypothetical protein